MSFVWGGREPAWDFDQGAAASAAPDEETRRIPVPNFVQAALPGHEPVNSAQPQLWNNWREIKPQFDNSVPTFRTIGGFWQRRPQTPAGLQVCDMVICSPTRPPPCATPRFCSSSCVTPPSSRSLLSPVPIVPSREWAGDGQATIGLHISGIHRLTAPSLMSPRTIMQSHHLTFWTTVLLPRGTPQRRHVTPAPWSCNPTRRASIDSRGSPSCPDIPMHFHSFLLR